VVISITPDLAPIVLGCIRASSAKQPAMTIPHLHEVDIGHDINVLLKIIVVNCH
jgi:hypothetical protein